MTRYVKQFVRVILPLAGSAGLLVLAGIVVSCNSVFSTPRQGWNRSYGAVVPHDKFPADCSLCHVGKNWTTIKKDFTFDHAKQTGVPLNGAHANVQCLLCHNDRGPAGKFAARGCAGCHVDIHRGRLGQNCSDCHTEQSWEPKGIIAWHNRTQFPLVGAHAATACFACHPGAQVGNFTGADTRCVTCHGADLARAKSPPHTAPPFSNNCQECHTPTGWTQAIFKHPAKFPLVGGHASVGCNACHKGGVFTGLSTDCVSCHLPDYQKTTDPNHAASGFSTDCKSCHSVNTWLGAKFTHPAAFPLTGGHGGLACSACHKGGVYTALPTSCVTCHQSDYQNTNDPPHAAAGFSTDCASCHTTTNWLNAKFTHPAAFPLTGGHGGLACSACHKNGVYAALPTTCVSCHQTDFQNTNNPNHTTAGLGTDCAACHTTQTWAGATFNHTAFPLTGNHNVACNQCHTDPNNLSTFSCIQCHAHSNQASVTSQHSDVSGFVYSATSCYSCHSHGGTGEGRSKLRRPGKPPARR